MTTHMTASRLAREVTTTGSLFFNRESMRHFGDTMRNYYVPVRPVPVSTYDGTTVMCWALQRKKPVKMGCTRQRISRWMITAEYSGCISMSEKPVCNVFQAITVFLIIEAMLVALFLLVTEVI